MTKHEEHLAKGFDEDIAMFRKSVNTLFKDDFNGTQNEPHSVHDKFDDLFSKDTFVISKEDLEMLNNDVRKHMVYVTDEEQWEDEEDNNDVGNDDVGNDVDVDVDDGEQNDAKSYEDENSDVDVKRPILPDNIDDTVDSDAEYDNTHFLYDPPNKYKDKILIYLLKLSPIVAIALIILFLTGIFTTDTIPNIPSTNMNPFLSHKLFVLEEEVKAFQNIGDKVSNLQKEIHDLNSKIDNLKVSSSSGINPGSNNLIDSMFDKVNKLESNIDSLSALFTKELLNKENKMIEKQQVPPKVSIQQQQKQKQQQPLSVKYFNIANKCSIIRQLTSYPPFDRQRRRKSLQSRIIHGFPDFIRRFWNGGPNTLPRYKTLGNIKLLSSANSPRNVLVESPTSFWQNPSSNSPIYFTININEPIKLHEIGIYHSKIPPQFNKLNDTVNLNLKKRWFNSAPKNVEILVRPINEEFQLMNKKMSEFFNQDLKFKVHKGTLINSNKTENWKNWIRIGELEYDINLNKAYQTLSWSNSKIKQDISKFHIQDIMFIIHSNWNDEMVVLDTIRIFQLDDDLEEINVTNNNYNYGDESEVIFLGEEQISDVN